MGNKNQWLGNKNTADNKKLNLYAQVLQHSSS